MFKSFLYLVVVTLISCGGEDTSTSEFPTPQAEKDAGSEDANNDSDINIINDMDASSNEDADADVYSPPITCSVALANCDGNSDNGCEINILKDTNNCGKCNKVCDVNQTCQNGECL